MRRLVAAIALLLVAGCVSASERQRSVRGPVADKVSSALPLWAGLQPGPYPVGFRSWLLRAQASEFKHGAPHLVQIGVWYPSASSAAPAMSFRDYLILELSENTYSEPTDDQRQKSVADFVGSLKSAGVSDATAVAFSNAPMFAHRDAPSLSGKRFPIVFVAQGNGESIPDQAVLAEYLSSHGYVVVTSPSVMRLTGPLTSDDQIGARAEEQADDIDRAASAIGDWPNAVNLPVSVIGYSFGARAALFYAMHHPVNALVSLDGGIGSANGVASMKAAPMFDPAAELPPILHLYEENDARMNVDLSFLRSLKTSSLDVQKLKSMRHVHFSTVGFAAAGFPDLARATGAGPGLRSDVDSMATKVLELLDRLWAPIRPR